jgi:hypothetical protein
MNWRTRAEASLNSLKALAAAWGSDFLSELQAEWHSRPLIRHLSALALCLLVVLVVLVGVLERSTKRASVATTINGTKQTVETRHAPARVDAFQQSTSKLSSVDQPIRRH